MQILGLSGSLRKGSVHTALLRAAAAMVPEGTTLEVRTLHGIPLYDRDLEDAGQDAVVALNDAIRSADAVLIACPEYNHSVSGVLKNAIDWTSRPAFRSVWVGKPVGQFSAAPSGVGGARGQAHLREVLHGMTAVVHPVRECVLGGIGGAFDAEGTLLDPHRRRLERHVRAFAAWASTLPRA